MKCREHGCDAEVFCRGYCSTHYQQKMRSGELQRLPKKVKDVCSVEGCNSPVHAQGLCGKHYQRLRKYGTLERPSGWRAPNGSGFVNSHGYRVVTMPDGVQKLEHRVIMEEYLGRPLSPDETVHHLDGDRLNNNVENLELWSSRHPKGQRIEDKIEFCVSFLSQYAPELLRNENEN